ncbi:Uncharacterized protein with conserved CXXC pairs [Alistipes sp. cv1]|nr:Uncharacterized protein with conserved CXXC pairs [Faecalibacterium prausnitzii]
MSSIKEVICICCPCGCHLQVDPENDYNVTGNACPNGAAYGREELTHPTRIITSTVRVEGGLYPMCAAPAWTLWQREICDTHS